MKKRLIVFFVCLLAVTLIVVLFAAVFTVGKVTFDTTGEEFDFSEEKLIADSGIKMRSSIFTLSVKKAVDNIEAANPWLKVVSAERFFPNKVEFVIAKRTPILAVKIKDSIKYALIDGDMRVVGISEDITASNIVIVTNIQLDIPVNGEGEVDGIVDISDGGGYAAKLEEITAAFADNGYGASLADFISKLEFRTGDGKVYAHTRTGVKLEIIINSNLKISDQVFGLCKVYDRYHSDDQRINGGIFFYDPSVGWNWKEEKQESA